MMSHLKLGPLANAPVVGRTWISRLPALALGGFLWPLHVASAQSSLQPSGSNAAIPAQMNTALPPVVSQKPADASQSQTDTFLRSLDATNGIKMWDIPFPSFDDSILGDVGGVRSALARYGLGFVLYSQNSFATNVLNRPHSTFNNEINYWGQRPSFYDSTTFGLTLDLSRYGIEGGQLAVTGDVLTSTDQNFTPSAFGLNSLYYYQSLFHKRIEFQIGYLTNGTTYIDPYIGGNVANTFGSSAAIQYEAGLSQTPSPAPGVNIKFNISRYFYDQFGIQRSLVPGANVFLTNTRRNPDGLRFSIAPARTVLIDEFGYKTPAGSLDLSTWIRAGIVQNNSPYTDLANGRTTTARGGYFLWDQQFLQLYPGSPLSSYRGLYAGFTAQFGSSHALSIDSYYEGRIFGLGLFPGRPTDILTLVYAHQHVSDYLTSAVNASSPITGVSAFSQSDSWTATYTAHVAKGVYLTGGLSYTEHPAVTYNKRQGDDLNFLAGAYFNF